MLTPTAFLTDHTRLAPNQVSAPDIAKEWADCLLMADTLGVLRVYEWQELVANRLQPRLTLKGFHEGWVHRIELVKDAGGLLSCSEDGWIKVDPHPTVTRP